MHISKNVLIVLLWLTSVTCHGQIIADSVATNQNTPNKTIDDGQFLPEDFDDLQIEQNVTDDSTLTKTPEIKLKKDTTYYPLISALSIYFDYPKIFSFFTKFENKAEVGLELQIFKHIYLRGELGWARIRPQDFYKNVDYEVSGNYTRGGIAYRKTIGASSNLIMGVNYGSSFFNDKGKVQIESPSGLHDPLEDKFKRENLRGNWIEMTFGTESHMGKNLYLGFTFRVRKLLNYDKFDGLDVFAVPGYGRTFDNSIPAINLYIKYRMQFY
ncbi:MAG: DUF6048 family protein [Bacteroidetes bacterium]|nr:DUF6048 family protein [Bacteroidota bacterium]MDA1121814.1 DUF6048 family protein [Bacteroidota bacterium]